MPPPTGSDGVAGPGEGGNEGDGAPRIGFSLSLKKSSAPASAAAPVAQPALGGSRDDEASRGPRRELITGVAGGKIASADPSSSSRAAAKKPLVIPALENTFKFGGGGGGAARQEEQPQRKRRFVPEPLDADASKTNDERFVLAGPEEAQGKMSSYGLQETKKKEERGEDDGAGGEKDKSEENPLAGLSVTSREWEAARYKHDVSLLPDEGDEESYEKMPVEDFAKALLRGMGWKEGEAKKGGPTASAVTRDGRRVDVGVVEFLPRPAGLGLGASIGPAPAEKGKRRDARWPTRPTAKASDRSRGDPADAPPRGTTMVDSSGRVRHSRRLGEVLVPAGDFVRGGRGLRPGASVAVVGGPHSGVLASVVSVSDSSAVRVRLLPSDEEVVVEREHLEASGAASEEKKSGGEERRRDDERRREEDKDRRRRSRSRSPRPSSKRPRGEGKGARRRSRSPPAPPATWLIPGIVVKVVDKRLEGGKFYLKKATVVDVPAPGVATLAVVSSSRSGGGDPPVVLSGVGASSLETAVPREPGAAVVVVEGPNRGRRGKLLARLQTAKGEPQGAVQLRGDLEVVQLPFDWFAEAAGGGGGGEGGGGGDDDDE